MAFSFLIFISSVFCSSATAALASSSSSSSSPLHQDQQALLQIKASIQALNPTILLDWSPTTTTSPCEWSRVTCALASPSGPTNDTYVSKLDLSSLSLAAGELPSGFSRLTALSSLNLSHNSLTGSTSQDIAKCTHLTTLDLSFNNLSTSDLAPLSNLQFLSLNTNNLTSTLTQVLPRNCARLQSIDLSSNHLASDLISYPWELCTSLQYLDLSNNLISGLIPANLASLPSLQRLILHTNSISGAVPASLCSYSPLSYLDLSENHITGSIPTSLAQCPSLQHLDLSSNHVSGEIKAANWVALEELILSENLLNGSIPTQIGSSVKLQVLMAGSNHLTGGIPSQLARCTALYLLDLNSNQLTGNLPDFWDELPFLRYVVLHSNTFTGSIPASLFTLPIVQFVDFSSNALSGMLPEQFRNLSTLQFLLIADNNLTGEIPPVLGSLTRLQFLDLSSNHLSGSIPSSLGSLKDLLWLMLAYNNLTGAIPRELGNCTSLLWLNLRSNSLSGSLPSEFASMGSNADKTFDYNAQYLHPPKALGECRMLKRWIPETYPPYSFIYLLLNRQSCKSYWTKLLTGTPLPSPCGHESPRIGGYIQLTDNKLTGWIPASFQGEQTSNLLLSLNSLTGGLPSSLGKLPLMFLNVSHNKLNGSISDRLGDNKCLTLLDLSFNMLHGSIPAALAGLSQLSRFNVSYNPFLAGGIPARGQFLTFGPSSYLGDSNLCLETQPGMRVDGTALGLPFCNFSSPSNLEVINNQTPSPPSVNQLGYRPLIIIGTVCCCAIAACAGICFYAVKNWPANSRRDHRESDDEDKFRGESSSSMDEFNDSMQVGLFRGNTCVSDAAEYTPQLQKVQHLMPPSPEHLSRENLTYSGILLATNNFDERHVLGSGGFGVVYKATLPDGTTVAIKKLAQAGGGQGGREFMAEMETLGMMDQENLVPLLGCCAFGSEKLLVYKFISNGSLEEWLHGRKGAGAQELSWPRRLRIASGCARALRYLHHECYPVFIHRDMKASNILVDDEFKGYVTDFGLAREVDPASSHVSTAVAGTLGYVPPEYCQTWRATTKGDVYSFGVVMLELITGRKPLCFADSYGSCDELAGSNLVEWVRVLLKESRGAEAYDEVVKQSAGGVEEELWAFLRLAASCTRDQPDHRPTMEAVSSTLDRLLQCHQHRYSLDAKIGGE